MSAPTRRRVDAGGLAAAAMPGPAQARYANRVSDAAGAQWTSIIGHTADAKKLQHRSHMLILPPAANP